jgi:site-specific DNA recombinase
MMKAVIIARVSTEEQKEAGNSLPAQIARLERYCANKNFIIIKQFSFDESAYKIDRATFDEIVHFVLEQNEVIAICCDKVDRLTRNMFDKRVSLLYEKALQDELELHFVSDGQVLTSKISAAEKFQFSISLGLAKYYSDAVSDNVKRSIEQKIRRGEWLAKAPYGYKNILNPDGTKGIIVHEYESLLVKKVFELYVAGIYSMEMVRQRMNADYKLDWCHSFIDKILNRHFYYGIMEIKGQLYPHCYPPLITKELFDQVQKVKDSFNKKQRYKYAGQPFLYRGLLQCAHCGLAITPERQKGYAYYHCTQYNGRHGAKWLREEKITEAISNVFRRIQIPPDIIVSITETLAEVHKNKIEFHNQQVHSHQKEHSDLSTMMDNLYLDKLRGRITESEYDKFFQKFCAQKEDLNLRLSRLGQAETNYFISVKQILKLTQRAYDLFESSEVDGKRHLIRLLLSNLRIEDEKVVCELQEPFSLILKCSDELSWRP